MKEHMPMCPICGEHAKVRAENKVFPFCSSRCKAVDLGKWLDEEYRIPVDDASPEDALSSAEATSPSKRDMRN